MLTQASLAADQIVNSLRVGTSGRLDLAGRRLEIDTGGIIVEGPATGQSIAVGNGTLAPGAAADGELVIHAVGNPIIEATNITDAGGRPTSLTVNSRRTVLLRGRSEYTGTTTVVRGTLAAALPEAVPTNANLVLDGGGYSLAYAGTTVTDLGRVTIKNGGSLGGVANAPVQFDAIEIDSGVISAKLAGDGPIVKSGAGRAQITADNSGYSGIIEVNGGELSSPNRAGTGTGLVRVNAGAIFDTRFGTVTPMQLNGGTFYGPTVGDEVDAPVHVSADSLLGSGTLSKELRIDSGVTLKTGLVNLFGSVDAAPGSTIVATSGYRLNVGVNTDLGGAARGVRVLVEPNGRLMLHGRQHLGRLEIAGGGARATLSSDDDRTLHTKALDIVDGGTLDLTLNDLIVQATAATRDSVLRNVTDWLRSGRAGGAWAGTGIVSTAASKDPLMGLAAVSNPGLATFSGEVIDENAVLVKYTYNGDANIDGKINADDYFTIDSGFLAQPPAPTYADGDFNYDEKINADDYFLIDSAFLGQGGPAAAIASVPEPGSAGAAAGLTAAILFRRRRRN